MKTSIPRSRAASPRLLARARERELHMAREAIVMVASGATTRVVIAGISHGDDILDAAMRLALEAGVRVKTLRQAGRDRADLVVEQIYK